MQKKQKLSKPIPNGGMKSLEEENRIAGRRRRSFVKELLLGNIGNNVERVWSAMQRVRLDVWLGRINAMLNWDCEKRSEIWIPNTRGKFLIASEGGQ